MRLETLVAAVTSDGVAGRTGLLSQSRLARAGVVVGVVVRNKSSALAQVAPAVGVHAMVNVINSQSIPDPSNIWSLNANGHFLRFNLFIYLLSCTTTST